MPDKRGKAFEVNWRIENLSSWLQTRDDCLYSPQFLAETLANTRWKLRLSRNLHLAEKYISLALARDIEDENPNPIALHYELSFLADDGSAFKSKSCTTKFAPKTVSLELNAKEVEVFEEQKEAYLPEGTLTVCCKLWKAWATLKGGKCSMRSVIGKKRTTLDGSIYSYIGLLGDSVTANFASSHADISFISFDVLRHSNNILTFENAKVKRKCLNFYSCKLLVLEASGRKFNFFDCIKIQKLFMSEFFKYQTSCYYHDFLVMLNNNNSLSLQLEITYYPAVESESIEYDNENYKKTIDLAEMENMSSSDLEDVHSDHVLELKNQTNFENNESRDENKCFDVAGKKNMPWTTFIEDISSLYNDRVFCDLKLQTDTETFPAHRNVLSVRSPVFKKMFTTDMKEKSRECMSIPDISSDTVRRMLQFLYTDYAGDLDMQIAKDLYVASDKYDIVSLKQRSSSYIKENLCPANVCEVIVLADMHQDKDLESAAHEFVLTYDKEVFGSDEWKIFMKNFCSLAAQVMYLKCMKE